VTLAEMKPGQKGRINSIDTSEATVVRLMVLGLVEEVPVQVKNIAIGGDPIEISLFGNSISIRKQDARRFGVTLE
jgi:ferrous iron transport protein A